MCDPHWDHKFVGYTLEQAPIVQQLLKLSENFKDHCTHH